jgi:hypothetical protein
MRLNLSGKRMYSPKIERADPTVPPLTFVDIR